MTVARMLRTSGKARRFVPLAGVFAAVVSCQDDQRSVTDPPRLTGPAAAVTAASTTNISPTADTYITPDHATHGHETAIWLYTWPDFTIVNAILMKFSLASIPPGSTISSATLNLYLTGSDGTIDPTYTVPVHQVVNFNPDLAAATGFKYDGVNPWTPNGCCGGAPMAQSDIGPAVDTKSIDKTEGFKQWDVTSIVQGWFSNPSSNFGLLVNSDPSKLRDRWRTFASTEHSVTGQRPYLAITYTPDMTPPPTPGQPQIALVSTDGSGATYSVTWSASVDQPSGQPVGLYHLTYGFNDGSWQGSSTASTNSAQVRFPYHASGQAAPGWLCVRAEDAAGNQSVDQACKGLTVPAQSPPPPPPPPPPPSPWPNEPTGFQQFNDQPWTCPSPLKFGQLCNQWNYDRRTSSKPADITADATAPLSPNDVMRIIFTADMDPNTEPGVNWIGLPGITEIYTAWWIKLSPNWTASPAGAGKMTFLFANEGGQVYTGLYHPCAFPNTEPEYGACSPEVEGPPYKIGANTEWAPYGQRIWYPNVATTSINPGQWYRVEFYYRWATTATAADGIIRWWVNGTLNGNHTNVRYPPSSFGEFQYAPTLQNPPPAEQYMYIDHTYVSKRP